MKRITAVFLLLLSLFLVGCGADISAYQDREILVVGLAEEDFSVTPRQLSEMKCTSETATGQSAKAGTVTANGSKPLDAYQQPMRVVIPGGSSGNWVRMVTKIEFVPLESGQ